MRVAEQPANVLLIEDSPDDAAFFMHTLGKCGVNVRLHVARDGVEALDCVWCRGAFINRGSEGPFKLILLDLKLPKVDGLEVLRALKSDAATQATPVVILSSSLEERDLSASYRLGANSYVLKPMDFEQYGECVCSLLRYWVQVNRVPNP